MEEEDNKLSENPSTQKYVPVFGKATKSGEKTTSLDVVDGIAESKATKIRKIDDSELIQVF